MRAGSPANPSLAPFGTNFICFVINVCHLEHHVCVLRFDSEERVEVTDQNVYDEYYKQYKRCTPQVRLAEGGEIGMDEISHVFDPLIPWIFHTRLSKREIFFL